MESQHYVEICSCHAREAIVHDKKVEQTFKSKTDPITGKVYTYNGRTVQVAA